MHLPTVTANITNPITNDGMVIPNTIATVSFEPLSSSACRTHRIYLQSHYDHNSIISTSYLPVGVSCEMTLVTVALGLLAIQKNHMHGIIQYIKLSKVIAI